MNKRRAVRIPGKGYQTVDFAESTLIPPISPPCSPVRGTDAQSRAESARSADLRERSARDRLRIQTG
ncbi:MAG: hypothetical protein ACM3XS_10505 [Bacteroidota bacterium]